MAEHPDTTRRDPASYPPSESQLWNLPNALTMLRIALVPVFGWLLMADGGGNEALRYAAAVVFIVASVTDFLDGYLARKRNLVTTFGKVADPIADKALTGVALIGLSLLGELSWWVTVIIIGREILVTLLRFWVIKHGVISASRGGKAKTVSQMIAIVLYVIPLTGWLASARLWVMALALVLTLLTGADYVRRALQVRAEGKRRQAAAGQSGGGGDV